MSKAKKPNSSKVKRPPGFENLHTQSLDDFLEEDAKKVESAVIKPWEPNIKISEVTKSYPKAGKSFWRKFVRERIQLDRTFRILVVPEYKFAQLSVYEPVHQYLKSQLSTIPPKTILRYVKSIKELEESNIWEVDKHILELIVLNDIMALPELTRTVLYYLTNRFDDLTLALTFILGKMNKNQFIVAHLIREDPQFGEYTRAEYKKFKMSAKHDLEAITALLRLAKKTS